MTNDAAGASAALTVDARGMRCPWPALRLARALRVPHPFRGDSAVSALRA